MSTKRSVGRLTATQDRDRSTATQNKDRSTATPKKDRSRLCAFTFPREPSIRKPFTIDTSKLTKFQAYNYL